MKNLFIILSLFIASSLFAQSSANHLSSLSSSSTTKLVTGELEIEKDPIFKAFLQEFEQPGSHLPLYIEAQNYRFDLTLKDLVDQVTLVTLKSDFQKYYQSLADSYLSQENNFLSWYQRLKEIIATDGEFKESLNKKLRLQVYNKQAIALPPNYKTFSLKKLLYAGLLSRITKYNKVANDPEGAGLVLAHSIVLHDPFYTKGLTVAKIKELKKKTIKDVRKSYYQAYRQLIEKQHQKEAQSYQNFPKIAFRYSKKNGAKLYEVSEKTEGESAKTPSYYKEAKKAFKIYNTLQELPHKTQLFAYLAKQLTNTSAELAHVDGHYLVTPIYLLKNWRKLEIEIREYSLQMKLQQHDDEVLHIIRKWIKANNAQVTKKLNEYNQANQTQIEYSLKKKGLPTRISTIENYSVLSQLFPEQPWFSQKYIDSLPTLYNNKGKAKYLRKGKFKLKLKNGLKNLVKVENYTSLIAGTATFFLTSGNTAISLGVKNIVKNAVSTVKHDKEWKEFLEQAPLEITSSFLLGAGFSSGRLYKILALGAGMGALQSLTTGQDLKVGAVVGAGLNFVNYYLLPVKWAKPMVQGFDQRSLNINKLLEYTHNTTRSVLQGTLVAGFTGESLGSGALKGGVYGVVSTALTIWFLGTRYFPFKDYDPAEVDAMIEAENAFQNDVGRGGVYEIDRQLIMDANFRVNGALPKIITASITLPGNVSMADGGFNRLTTLTHEAHHLMQQHQSGVYGFYLFRYIPTALRTGYDGHPDENFLRRFLTLYL